MFSEDFTKLNVTAVSGFKLMPGCDKHAENVAHSAAVPLEANKLKRVCGFQRRVGANAPGPIHILVVSRERRSCRVHK